MHDLGVFIEVRTLCQHLKLDLDRADLQIADKGVDNAPLFSGTSEQKIDRYHLNQLDIPVILGVDNAVCNLFNRQILRYGVEKGRVRFASAVRLLLFRCFRRPGFLGMLFLCRLLADNTGDLR